MTIAAMNTANLPDQRQEKRLRAKSAIVVSPQGICQVFNISNSGLLFKCRGQRPYPDQWAMELFDINGQKLENLAVQKVWEKHLQVSPLAFSCEIGVKFTDLTAAQQAKLKLYLRQLANRKAEHYL